MIYTLKNSKRVNFFIGLNTWEVYILLLFCFAPVLTAFSQNISYQEAINKLTLLRKSKPDTNRVNLQQALSQYLIFKSGEALIDLDSAISLADQATSLSKKMAYHTGIGRSLLLNAMAHREKGERDSGKLFAQEAIEAANNRNDFLLLGESLRELSQYYSIYVEGEYSEKVKIITQTVEAFSKTKNAKKHAEALQDLADMYSWNEEWPAAIKNLTQCLQLYETINYPGRQEAYSLLNYCLNGIGVYDEASKNGHQALKVAKQLGDSTIGLVSIYYRLASTYNRLAHYDSALIYFEKAYHVADQLQDRERLYVISRPISEIYLKQNNPQLAIEFLQRLSSKYPVPDKANFQIFTKFNMVFALLDAHRYEEADQVLSDAITVLDHSNLSLNSRATFLTACAKAYVKLKRFKQASAYLKQLDKLVLDDMPEHLVAVNEYRYKIDSAQGNHRSALKHLQLFTAMKNTLNEREKNNQLKNLKLYYQAAQKDRDIQIQEQSISLLRNQNELQQNALSQLDLKQKLTMAGVFILLFISSVLLYFFHAKQILNKKIHEKNKLLQRLVTEKEWLLKEVHHRVKNNLQTVVSLLESQSALLENDALAAMQDCQNRVYAMSLIHQRLYQSENIESIDMGGYVNELVSYLRDIFGTSGRIQYKINIGKIKLDINQAIPIGLILNEAITNSIKYAFPSTNISCQIIIDIQITHDDLVRLSVRDNGIGFINNNQKQKSSLGMRLMRGLTEDLDGNITISTFKGTSVEIMFPLNNFTQRDQVA